jgi:hypothetical protein
MTLALRPQFFHLDNETGLVTILEPGVYQLYAQVNTNIYKNKLLLTVFLVYWLDWQ